MLCRRLLSVTTFAVLMSSCSNTAQSPGSAGQAAPQPGAPAGAAQTYDFLIVNARIVHGTPGRPLYGPGRKGKAQSS
jgi:hypothetical protein